MVSKCVPVASRGATILQIRAERVRRLVARE